ncbi:hypothetical protein MKW98_005971 [Papaver atlanticum]|uniref:Uncharacterized protein n=1 Tax=Papaver atlanticum TaxID=357466 RepID=A0AAD4S734_9MAGN|nr:hypothetical protein MKW98_005971 [Papaver atlanticum]
MTTFWFNDPSLFMEHFRGEIITWRLYNQITAPPLSPFDFILETKVTNLTDPLPFVGNLFTWKSSDFVAFIAYLNSHDIFVNCQGLVITTTFPRETTSGNAPNMQRIVRFKSHEVLNMALYGLPVMTIPFREVQYLDGGGPSPVENTPKENELAATLGATIKERDQEKAEKLALAETVSVVAGIPTTNTA